MIFYVYKKTIMKKLIQSTNAALHITRYGYKVLQVTLNVCSVADLINN